MVDIIVGVIPPVQNSSQKRDRRRGQGGRKRCLRERRRSATDRRQAVRDGVVVTLSYAADRRKQPDRRKGDPPERLCDDSG